MYSFAPVSFSICEAICTESTSKSSGNCRATLLKELFFMKSQVFFISYISSRMSIFVLMFVPVSTDPWGAW
uniref:Uncharacterized protein n=1 Tax=Anguilla anguilla TaxID=7936 RepID=A0A0E9WMY4_ANGAN